MIFWPESTTPLLLTRKRSRKHRQLALGAIGPQPNAEKVANHLASSLSGAPKSTATTDS
jgi:hypothetical protein